MRSTGAPANVRALLVVSAEQSPPARSSPRASCNSSSETCRSRGWALIADEVFADYPLETAGPVTDIAARSDVLRSLRRPVEDGGAAAIEAWLVHCGRSARGTGHGAARARTDRGQLPVGRDTGAGGGAAPAADGAAIRAAIQTRIEQNLAALRAAAARHPSCETLKVEGGWSAVIRVPSTRTRKIWCSTCCAASAILVHPGYFFDFAREAYVVVSLLPRSCRL